MTEPQEVQKKKKKAIITIGKRKKSTARATVTEGTGKILINFSYNIRKCSEYTIPIINQKLYRALCIFMVGVYHRAIMIILFVEKM